ncbi:TadE/TadG family type IV pilus assembly protein [Sphingomonas metalli]|uniref:TadE/TadG family type IV pilus assembly protein n=1 Tax=Sphingomonas metalli TaxID=1779358 RepID=UPI0016689EC1|nr:TadE/TadG family type IV pilus assembly protein [Sphingomonas metalli]
MLRKITRNPARNAPASFLARLRRDRRGNTLAMMAAAMVPMIGFAGSAVDMSRLYVVKVRLQQACDAGVLASRKAMTDTSISTPLETAASTQGQTFFSNNFRTGWFANQTPTFTQAKASVNTDPTVANGVSGTATVNVPMAMMGFFGVQTKQIRVTCQAVFDMADTDVMFVLDTTGSMSCVPSAALNCANGISSYTRSDGTTGYYNVESSGSKLEALRQAVILFDSTIRSSSDPNTKYRYGFVTYSSAVNVGRLIPRQYLQSNVTYQTRRIIGDYNYGGTYYQEFSNDYNSCPRGQTVRRPVTGYARSSQWFGDDGYYQARNYSVYWNNGKCAATAQPLRPLWRYGPANWDTTVFLNSISSGSPAADDPTRLDGSTSRWTGCVEELDTTTGSSFSVTSLPDDLNPDSKPTTATNLWRPMWADATWQRDGTAEQDVKDDAIGGDSSWGSPSYNYSYRSGGYMSGNGFISCGMPAQKLKVMTAQNVRDYVYDADFKALGGTYHDVGMIWGARMISQDGIFAADTARWPGRKDPQRTIVFMTDGNMAPNRPIYGLWGVEQNANRTGGATDDGTNYDNHVARFRVVCDAAKRKGVTIYVVALGTAITPDLTYCASPGQTYQASSTQQLTDAFRNIAQRIAMLRIAS